MAGDWMKIELELPDKPEVHAIASTLSIDPDAVVGKLIRVWQWFDKHTEDGNAFGVTYSLLDRITGVTGFGEAMMFAGWLEQNDKYLTMPKFDKHTSASAKSRANTKTRVNKHRGKDCNALDVTKALPEKKREEKNNSTAPLETLLLLQVEKQYAVDWLAIRKAKKLSFTESALNSIKIEAVKANMSFPDAIKTAASNSWGGFKASWVVNDKPEPKKAWE